MQHLAAFALLMIPVYGVLLAAIALLDSFGRKLLPAAVPRAAVLPVAAAILLVFSDNVLRAAAALIALDEKVRVRRFLSFRVFWKLVKAGRSLVATQARSLFSFRPGLADSRLSLARSLRGREPVRERGRASLSPSDGRLELGRARSRHSSSCPGGACHRRGGQIPRPPRSEPARAAATSAPPPGFPCSPCSPLRRCFFTTAPAAQKEGPLLQLDRTPEIRITARPLSVSSTRVAGARRPLPALPADSGVDLWRG